MHDARFARILTAGILCWFLAVSPALANEEEEAQRELEALSRELNALDDWVTDAERTRKEKQSEVRRLDKRVEHLDRSMRESRALIVDQNAAIAELESESRILDAQIQRQGEALAKLGASYKRLSGKRYAMLLFELETARQIDRVIRYTQILRDRYFEQLEDYASTVTNYKDIRNKLQQGIEREQSLQDGLVDQREDLLTEKRERTSYIASLETELITSEQRRRDLVQAAERIKELLERLRSRLSIGTGADFIDQQGSLPWPAQGRLVHRYGTRRSGTNLTWQGVFIATDTQKEIRAVHSGTTIYQDWLNGFGHLMVIAHGDHHMTLYAQADSFYKSVNEPVEGGEVIGVTGASGGAGQRGIYFEIRVDGKPENPQRWLSNN